MRQICPDCKGKGKVLIPITMTEKKLVTCETCQGTGYLDGEYDEIITKLDKILDLLEKK